MARWSFLARAGAIVSSLVLVGGYVAYQAGCIHMPGAGGDSAIGPAAVDGEAAAHFPNAPGTQPADASVRDDLSVGTPGTATLGPATSTASELQPPIRLMSGSKSASSLFTAPRAKQTVMPGSKSAAVFTPDPQPLPEPKVELPPPVSLNGKRQAAPAPPALAPMFSRTAATSRPSAPPASQPSH